jgi:hypothetical protein
MKVTTDQNEWEVQDSFTSGGPMFPSDIVINSAGEARIEVTDNEIRLIADKVVIDCPRKNKPIKINDKEVDDEEDENSEDEDQAEHGTETAQTEETEREEAGAVKAVSGAAKQAQRRTASRQTKDFLKNCGPSLYDSIIATRKRMNQDPLDAEPSSKSQAKDCESIAGAIDVLSKYADILEEGVKTTEDKAKPHVATECVSATLPGQKKDPNTYRDLKHYSDKCVGPFWRAGTDDTPLKMWDYSWRRKRLEALNKAVEKYADDVSAFDGDVLKRQAYIDKVKKHIQHGKAMKLFPRGITETEIQCNSTMDWSKWKPKKQRVAEAAKAVTESVKVSEPVNGKSHPKAEEKGSPPIKSPLRTTSKPSFLQKALSVGAGVLREVATKLEEL